MDNRYVTIYRVSKKKINNAYYPKETIIRDCITKNVLELQDGIMDIAKKNDVVVRTEVYADVDRVPALPSRDKTVRELVRDMKELLKKGCGGYEDDCPEGCPQKECERVKLIARAERWEKGVVE